MKKILGAAIQVLAVLWIRIRMDLVLLPGSGSGILVLDPDPAKSERVYYCEFWTVCTIGQ